MARGATSRVGELVGGKYRILRLIAEGGMGVVYEAQHAVVKRRFAVKFLRADLANRREILTRFHREAQAAGALENENIAAAIDFGILSDGAPYIVMEYLVGESLGTLLDRENRLPIQRAADLCLQACHGMGAAHASGIIHRDLKPENLFVCRRGDGTDLLKVLDFGIAKLEQLESNDAATRTGAILGTPAYMSPEQARGAKTIDHRTDIYGLAAILFEMVSGQKPHPGDSHNAILHHIATQPAVSLRTVHPDLPEPLLDAVQQALASDPTQRHPSVEIFGQIVGTFGRREVWPPAKSGDSPSDADVTSAADGEARAIRPAVLAGDSRFDASTLLPSGQPARPPRAGRRVIGIAASLAAVAAIAAGFGMRWAGRPASVLSEDQADVGGVGKAGDVAVQSSPVRSAPPALRDRQGPPEIRAAVEPQPAAPTAPLASTPTKRRAGRPLGRPGLRPTQRTGPPNAVLPQPPATTESRTPRPAFDPQNPYGE